MNRNAQLRKADKLGSAGFSNGLKAACHDKALMSMLRNTSAPAPKASQAELVLAWNQSWHSQRTLSQSNSQV